MSKQISELNWKKRLLVISYQNEDDLVFIQTTKFISNNTCQIVDRNLEIIFFENFKNKQYTTPDFIEDKYIFIIFIFIKEVSKKAYRSRLIALYIVISSINLPNIGRMIQDQFLN